MIDEFKPGDKVVWRSHGHDDTPGVGPAEDVAHSRCCCSLMNCGHDPLKGE